MKAIAAIRGKEGPQLLDLPRPSPGPGEGLLRVLEVGIDGTDEEILRGAYGEFPRGEDHMVLGHEALARVEVPPPDADVAAGDLVVPTVRRPCGLCLPCGTGCSDFCETGRYRERGIKGLHGYMAEQVVEAGEFLVKVDPDLAPVAVLAEPLSIAVKALEQALWARGRLPSAAPLEPLGGRRVLVVGAGTLGILAALLCRRGRAATLIADRQPDDAPKSQLIRRLGLEHVNAREVDLVERSRALGGFDLIVEATGSPAVPFPLVPALAPNGVMVLLGVPEGGGPLTVDAPGVLRATVLGNLTLVGSVNSNVRHFRLALGHLRDLRGALDGGLEALITHRLPYPRFREAFALREAREAVKRVLTFSP